MPNGGVGQFRRIAAHLGLHTTRVSQIFRGSVHLTQDQAIGLCRYFGMSPLESEYFLALIELEKAGTEALREHLRARLAALRERSQDLIHRVPKDRVLSESERAIFYSSWHYSAVSLASMLKDFRSLDAISQRFGLTPEKVRKIIEFLISTGICVENADGEIEPGTRMTHLESTSPLVIRHHANWRMKAMQKHENLGAQDIAYSAPVSVSAADQILIRESIALFIENFLKTVKKSSPDEKMACLNLDWFEI